MAVAKQDPREMILLAARQEDLHYIMERCRRRHVYIGNGEQWPALHTREYDFNDRILETAVHMFLQLAEG